MASSKLSSNSVSDHGWRAMRRFALVSACFTAACTANETRNAAAQNQLAAERGDHKGLLVARQQVPGYLASMTGLLTFKDGCVVLDSGRSVYVLVWPIGTTFSADRRSILVQQDDGTTASYKVGRSHTLVGGAVSNVDGSSNAYEPPGNSACRGQAWIVSATNPKSGEDK